MNDPPNRSMSKRRVGKNGGPFSSSIVTQTQLMDKSRLALIQIRQTFDGQL